MASEPKRRIRRRDFGHGNNGAFCASLVGKTIERFTLDGPIFGILFADGTWIFGEAESDGFDDCFRINLDAFATADGEHDLGIITDEELEAIEAREEEGRRARQLEEFERLKSELGL